MGSSSSKYDPYLYNLPPGYIPSYPARLPRLETKSRWHWNPFTRASRRRKEEAARQYYYTTPLLWLYPPGSSEPVPYQLYSHPSGQPMLPMVPPLVGQAQPQAQPFPTQMQMQMPMPPPPPVNPPTAQMPIPTPAPPPNEPLTEATMPPPPAGDPDGGFTIPVQINYPEVKMPTPISAMPPQVPVIPMSIDGGGPAVIPTFSDRYRLPRGRGSTRSYASQSTSSGSSTPSSSAASTLSTDSSTRSPTSVHDPLLLFQSNNPRPRPPKDVLASSPFRSILAQLPSEQSGG